jgi:hypothetical protein
MHIQPIQNAVEKTPFQPFEIETTGGRTVLVKHPDFLLFSESKNTIVVTEGDHVYLIGVNEVSSIRYREALRNE